jgi:cellulose synthase/poly-beta-1,6-N-acetylglucosamine synthase-like glycosyltransferase
MLPRLGREYMRAFLTARVANHLGSLLLVSGAFSLFRRSGLIGIGGYRHDHDRQISRLIVHIHAMREQRRDYRLEFIARSCVLDQRRKHSVVCGTSARALATGNARNAAALT